MFFFALLLWTGSASIYDYRLSHSRPMGYFASDAFQNYGIAVGIQEQGDYRQQPIAVAGGYKDVVGHHPPILYVLPGIFSSISGLPVYDSIFLIVLLFFSIAPLGIYFIIRKHNKNLAIIALPFSLLIFTGKFYSAFTWGQWGFLTGNFFAIFAAWAATRFEMRKCYVLLALFLTSAFYGHAAGFIFASGFALVYAALLILHKKFEVAAIKEVAKNLAIVGIIFFALSAYYIIIFQNTWARSQPFTFEAVSVKDIQEGRPFPAIIEKDFGPVLLVLLVIGLVVAGLILFKSFDSSIIAGLFLSGLGYSNMIGFGSRAFQLRFIWPLYLSVFFGLAIYRPLRLLLKNWRTFYSVGIALIAGAILLLVYYTPIPATLFELVSQEHWDGMTQISKNTEKDSKVLFLFQDFMSQTAIYYATQRETYLVEVKDYLKAIDESRVKRSYVTARNAEFSTGLPYRKGLFSFGYHKEEEKLFRERDICSFDYYVVDKAVLSLPEIASYNLLLLKEFIDNGMQVVYNNEALTILKNGNKGGACVDETGI